MNNFEYSYELFSLLKRIKKNKTKGLNELYDSIKQTNNININKEYSINTTKYNNPNNNNINTDIEYNLPIIENIELIVPILIEEIKQSNTIAYKIYEELAPRIKIYKKEENIHNMHNKIYFITELEITFIIYFLSSTNTNIQSIGKNIIRYIDIDAIKNNMLTRLNNKDINMLKLIYFILKRDEVIRNKNKNKDLGKGDNNKNEYKSNKEDLTKTTNKNEENKDKTVTNIKLIKDIIIKNINNYNYNNKKELNMLLYITDILNINIEINNITDIKLLDIKYNYIINKYNKDNIFNIIKIEELRYLSYDIFKSIIDLIFRHTNNNSNIYNNTIDNIIITIENINNIIVNNERQYKYMFNKVKDKILLTINYINNKEAIPFDIISYFKYNIINIDSNIELITYIEDINNRCNFYLFNRYLQLYYGRSDRSDNHDINNVDDRNKDNTNNCNINNKTNINNTNNKMNIKRILLYNLTIEEKIIRSYIVKYKIKEYISYKYLYEYTKELLFIKDREWIDKSFKRIIKYNRNDNVYDNNNYNNIYDNKDNDGILNIAIMIFNRYNNLFTIKYLIYFIKDINIFMNIISNKHIKILLNSNMVKYLIDIDNDKLLEIYNIISNTDNSSYLGDSKNDNNNDITANNNNDITINTITTNNNIDSILILKLRIHILYILFKKNILLNNIYGIDNNIILHILKKYNNYKFIIYILNNNNGNCIDNGKIDNITNITTNITTTNIVIKNIYKLISLLRINNSMYYYSSFYYMNIEFYKNIKDIPYNRCTYRKIKMIYNIIKYFNNNICYNTKNNNKHNNIINNNTTTNNIYNIKNIKYNTMFIKQLLKTIINKRKEYNTINDKCNIKINSSILKNIRLLGNNNIFSYKLLLEYRLYNKHNNINKYNRNIDEYIRDMVSYKILIEECNIDDIINSYNEGNNSNNDMDNNNTITNTNTNNNINNTNNINKDIEYLYYIKEYILLSSNNIREEYYKNDNIRLLCYQSIFYNRIIKDRIYDIIKYLNDGYLEIIINNNINNKEYKDKIDIILNDNIYLSIYECNSNSNKYDNGNIYDNIYKYNEDNIIISNNNNVYKNNIFLSKIFKNRIRIYDNLIESISSDIKSIFINNYSLFKDSITYNTDSLFLVLLDNYRVYEPIGLWYRIFLKSIFKIRNINLIIYIEKMIQKYNNNNINDNIVHRLDSVVSITDNTYNDSKDYDNCNENNNDSYKDNNNINNTYSNDNNDTHSINNTHNINDTYNNPLPSISYIDNRDMKLFYFLFPSFYKTLIKKKDYIDFSEYIISECNYNIDCIRTVLSKSGEGYILNIKYLLNDDGSNSDVIEESIVIDKYMRVRPYFKSKRNNFILRLNMLLHSSNKLMEVVSFYKINIDNKLDSVSFCCICYFYTELNTKALVEKKCNTCNNWYHSKCLNKWIGRSKSGKCAICRQDIFE